MAIPAIERLAGVYVDGAVDVWCPFQWAPVLEMANLPVAVIPFRPGRGVKTTVKWLRGPRYRAAYLFAQSFASASAVWLAGVPRRRGIATGIRRWMLSEPVDEEDMEGEHRVSAFLAVADRKWRGGRPPAPKLVVPERAEEQFRQLVAGRFRRPVVGIVPGSTSGARRWPEGRFTALAGMLAAEGGSQIVFGSSGDEVLAARVAAGAGSSGIDLGGRTSLAVFAAALKACDAVVTNDSGALQLAAAVGASVIGVFGPRSPDQTGPLHGRGRALWHWSLPCAPCGKDVCPRRSEGTFLPEGFQECLQLVSVETVARAVRAQLSEAGASEDG